MRVIPLIAVLVLFLSACGGRGLPVNRSSSVNEVGAQRSQTVKDAVASTKAVFERLIEVDPTEFYSQVFAETARVKGLLSPADFRKYAAELDRAVLIQCDQKCSARLISGES